MASGAHLWWSPPGERLQDLDTLRPLTSIEDYEQRDEAIAVSFSGRRTRTVFTVTRAVDVVSDLLNGTNYDVIRQCETLCNHLLRGGLVSISENDRSFGAYLSFAPDHDALTWNRNLYSNFGNFTPIAGDILVLCGPGPTLLWEEVEVETGGAGTHVTLTESVTYDWTQQPYIFVRNKGFWPALRLRSDADPSTLIAHGNRISFQLQLPLEVPPDAYDALAVSPTDPIAGTSDDSVDIRAGQVGQWAPSWTPLSRKGWGG